MVDEDFEGGISVDEGLKIVQWLKEIGQIDFFNVICGYIDIDFGLMDVIFV